MAITKASAVGSTDFIGKAIREDLAGKISNISPDKTPFISSIGSTSVSSARHDWNVEALVAPADNAAVEGVEFTTSKNVDRTVDRISNYTQIMEKHIHVSKTLMASNTVGAKDWFRQTLTNRTIEMRRDRERKHLLYNNLTVDGNVVFNGASDPRRSAGLAAYVANFVTGPNAAVEINGASGAGTAVSGAAAGKDYNIYANAAYTPGEKVLQFTAAPTATTVSVANVKTMMELMFLNGGSPKVAMVPAGIKTALSAALIGTSGSAERRVSEMSKKLNLAVDSVITEFGFDITIVPSDIMSQHAGDAASSVYFYDPATIRRGVLVGNTMEEDGTARHGKAALITSEETLIVDNPNAVGMLIGVKA